MVKTYFESGVSELETSISAKSYLHIPTAASSISTSVNLLRLSRPPQQPSASKSLLYKPSYQGQVPASKQLHPILAPSLPWSTSYSIQTPSSFTFQSFTSVHAPEERHIYYHKSALTVSIRNSQVYFFCWGLRRKTIYVYSCKQTLIVSL